MSEDALRQLLERHHENLPVGDGAETGVKYVIEHFGKVLDVIGGKVLSMATAFESVLVNAPSWLIILIFIALGYWRRGWRFALFVLASLSFIIVIGMWEDTMKTLALVLSSSILSLACGIPLGIWAARNKTVEALLRPVMDFMQTMPAFVYLIPAVSLFGLGLVPALLAAMIFAMPASVRMTSLGLRQVNKELVEAGHAFGCTSTQLLLKVQIPAALPSIMAGVNQTIMLVLSMIIIASFVGAGGLGEPVMRGMANVQIGPGAEGGLSVVLLAVILDRITETFGNGRGKQQAMS
ncbi:ABC transporter permease [Leeia aquatica]|uniref:ABC transporter permease subunit n=1 Tax=Leeia aquatica TaxID=2725557 RepID=A0A847S916_9NEIS|nr:ABC transporter permease subunit [Leeia aquatica]NLR73849.1 ABC transporter permease subunit [Leeia aquatica]